MCVLFCLKSFFLAGTLQSGQQTRYSRRGTGEEEQGRKNSIFYGFDDELLAETFGVDQETASRLKGRDDQRGHIVRAERFNLVLPGEEERERYPENGLEETLCTAKLRHNLDEPSRADVYNPRGGRISTLNSQSLPILGFLRLSAEKGFLYRVKSIPSPNLISPIIRD